MFDSWIGAVRRYRLGVPAIFVGGGYVVALVVAAVSVLITGDIRILWRLMLIVEIDEALLSSPLSMADEGATWPKVIVLLATGGLWAWALWQSLRGPVVGRRPGANRSVRVLRGVLYTQVVCWLVYAAVPAWTWWAAVLEPLVMLAVTVAFHPVLKGTMGSSASLVLFAGVLSNVLIVAEKVSPTLGWRAAPTADSGDVILLTGLIWMIIILVAQWQDGRWRRATIGYGIASLIAPIVLLLAGIPLGFIPGLQNVYGEAVTLSASVLSMIWIARSAHDLADPHSRPAPPRPLLLPLSAQPGGLAMTARLTMAARLAACAAPIVPALVNLSDGHLLWITPHVPMKLVTRLAGDALSGLWWAFELAAGTGGVAVLVLIAANRETRRTFRVAMTALFLTATAGLTAVVATTALGLFLNRVPYGFFRTGYAPFGIDLDAFAGRGLGVEPAISPLWFTTACLASAALLWWARIMRITNPDHSGCR
ncbi:hypothetical protein [Acrocarpospora corrugata]|uniref:hypothetical protein n=1 Tax=Acrocarpospora corrugata TaxID=35763 RepID=UPI0012D2DA82|nr:hypothetical protein [Acrocarpospora corrugata]